ncbi:adenylate/guanylate cyclase domain-containing protein [Candidatus Poribacteria bacterium]|nr:MAG: adenylate/guanylate cyclase domain-containing protein [Candidatus Poribacteria bacterium]
MSLVEDYTEAVEEIFNQKWDTRDGKKVPEPEDLRLGNDAVQLNGTVLYADLDASTNLVDSYKPGFAAKIYKAYLSCAAKVIRSEGGVITSYDGDRIMAVYIGNSKNSSAAQSALKINYTVTQIINPILKKYYPDTSYRVRQVVGIDTSDLFVARTGIRGSNDLVWVGRAANYAAKLCSLSPDYPSWITETAYNRLNDAAKYSSDGKLMWEAVTWNNMYGMKVYRSTWWRRV